MEKISVDTNMFTKIEKDTDIKTGYNIFHLITMNTDLKRTE
jgi:hypothetical protein